MELKLDSDNEEDDPMEDIEGLLKEDEQKANRELTSLVTEMSFTEFKHFVLSQLPNARLSKCHRLIEISWAKTAAGLEMQSRVHFDAAIVTVAAMKRLADIGMASKQDSLALEQEVFGFVMDVLNRNMLTTEQACTAIARMLEPLAELFLKIGNNWLKSARQPTVLQLRMKSFTPAVISDEEFSELEESLFVKHVETTTALAAIRFKKELKTTASDTRLIRVHAHLGALKAVGSAAVIVKLTTHTGAEEEINTILEAYRQKIQTVCADCPTFEEFNYCLFDQMTGPGAYKCIVQS